MHKKLFIPGPVEVREDILKAMSKPMIGHRTGEYKELMGSLKEPLQKLMFTKNDVLISTSSGSGFLEGGMRNCVSKKVLNCVNGAFSKKWADIAVGCAKQNEVIKVDYGKAIKPEMVDEKLATGEFDAICVTHNETSTGVMNNLEELSEVIKKYPEVIWMVDCVSSLAGVKVEVDKLGIDVCLASSQKALALPPGIAVASISEKAYKKAETVEGRGYYFDFLGLKKSYDKDQTPYTPSISHLYALQLQLETIMKEGVENRFERHTQMADFVRKWAKDNFEMFSESGYESNTISCITNTKCADFNKVKEEMGKRGYGIDSGYRKLNSKLEEAGKPTTFRIAHMGDTTMDDIKVFIKNIEEVIGGI
ncbi:pyridoxal-phosphate-dependent aminotransferase family protein [Nanoarchaeota archaeon]